MYFYGLASGTGSLWGNFAHIFLLRSVFCWEYRYECFNTILLKVCGVIFFTNTEPGARVESSDLPHPPQWREGRPGPWGSSVWWGSWPDNHDSWFLCHDEIVFRRQQQAWWWPKSLWWLRMATLKTPWIPPQLWLNLESYETRIYKQSCSYNLGHFQDVPFLN